MIDVNNELPLFEKSDVSQRTPWRLFLTLFDGFPDNSVWFCVCVCEQYGSFTLGEDTPVGHTVLNITATDADDPDSGSSLIEFHISAGNENEFFTVETDGKGIGHVVIAKVKYICSLRLQHHHSAVTIIWDFRPTLW